MHPRCLSRNGTWPLHVHIVRMADCIIRNNVREPVVLYCGDSVLTDTFGWEPSVLWHQAHHCQLWIAKGMPPLGDRVHQIPSYVFIASGDNKEDAAYKHDILVECNFVDAEQIAWQAYVKAEQD